MEENAIFAAGCFWGVEDTFRHTKGVFDAVSGYIGGESDNPSYEEVCSGRSGHAEAVRVSYDPERISYEDLLAIFWKLHDPTQHNRQGPDVGSQYRSAIFYSSNEQRQAAESSKARLEESGIYKSPIATEITLAQDFYPAEDYHQRYFEKTGRRAC